MSEFVTGTITGCIASLVGFSVTMLYERHKQITAKKELTKKNLDLLFSELSDNLRIAGTNIELLNYDIDATKNQKDILPMPCLFHNDGWHLVQANGIYSGVHQSIFEKLAETYLHLSFINTQLGTRQLHKVSDFTVAGYRKLLLGYDVEIKELCIKGQTLIQESILIIGLCKQNPHTSIKFETIKAPDTQNKTDTELTHEPFPKAETPKR